MPFDRFLALRKLIISVLKVRCEYVLCSFCIIAVCSDVNEMRMIIEDKSEVAAVLPVHHAEQGERELNQESVSVNNGQQKTGVCVEKVVREGIKIAQVKASSTAGSVSEAWSRLDP